MSTNGCETTKDKISTSKRTTSLRTVAETLSKSLSYCVTLASHCEQEERKSSKCCPVEADSCQDNKREGINDVK